MDEAGYGERDYSSENNVVFAWQHSQLNGLGLDRVASEQEGRW